MMYVRYEVQQTEFYCHLGPSLALLLSPPLTAWKMKLSKMKKLRPCIIILHKCTKIMIISYITPEIWRLRDVIVFLILGFTFHFYPPNSPKIKISKTEKRDWRYHHFTQASQKSSPYASQFLRYGAWQMCLLFFILGYFLHFHHTNMPQKIRILKNLKQILEISSFCTSLPQNQDQLIYCTIL